jgi:pimeloyl-ACP methyl ester carboxylesterase
MPTVRSGQADIVYEVVGDGEPLLMIMGFASDARAWMLQTPAFGMRYRCIMPNNRGVGGSTLPGGTCTLDELALDALAVLDELGIERAHVLGVSMGGAIAQHLALKAPERVRSLTLAVTWCAQNPYTERIARFGRATIERLDPEAFTSGLMLFTFTPKFLIEFPEMAAGIEALTLEFFATDQAFYAQMQALLDHEVRADLANLELPTLVMVAQRDVMVPPELGRQVAATIPGAELVELTSGHACNIEEYEAFNRAVLDFIVKH